MATLKGFVESFTGSDFDAENEVTITENSGQLPSNPAAFTWLSDGGQLLDYGTHYTINGSKVKILFDPTPWQTYTFRFWTVPAGSADSDDSCLDGIIGISQTDCECHDPKAGSYNLSKSGLYLDELQSLGSMANFDNCEGETVWEVFEKSIVEAKKIFLADLRALVLRNYDLTRKTFKGTIGEATASGSANANTNTYQGVEMYPLPIRSGVLKIKNIGTLFTQTGTINLKVYNSLNELIANLTLNTTASQHTKNTVDIELPMLAEYSQNTKYFFVVDASGGNKPKMLKAYCGSCSGGKLTYSQSNPYFYQNNFTAGKGWANWLMVTGFSTDTLTFDDYAIEAHRQEQIFGLTFEVELSCNIDKILCTGEFDFDRDPLSLSTAFAIRYQAGKIGARKMLMRENLSRPNMMNRVELEQYAKEWGNSYVEMVSYIADNVNLENADCFTCKNEHKSKLQAVLS